MSMAIKDAKGRELEFSLACTGARTVYMPDGSEVPLDEFRALARWALTGGLFGMPGDPWHGDPDNPDLDRLRPVFPPALTDGDLALIRRALDLLIRVHLGQFTQAGDPLIMHLFANEERVVGTTPGQFCNGATLRSALESVSARATGMMHGGPGLFNPNVADEARRAYRVLAKMKGDDLGVGMIDEDGKACVPRETEKESP